MVPWHFDEEEVALGLVSVCRVPLCAVSVAFLERTGVHGCLLRFRMGFVEEVVALRYIRWQTSLLA